MEHEIRHDEYVKQLLEKRKKEVIKADPINEVNLAKGEGITAPTSTVSLEETRILQGYMEQRNLFQVTSVVTNKKKELTLRHFFKSKRNQQVEVYATIHGDTTYHKGKVSAIGRDFVTITNLKERIWIPYHQIDTANIPYGIPNYSNTHQHHFYDNDLRKKLLQNFGETVSQRDTLIQQFHFESLSTNLARWKDTWIEVKYSDQKSHFGKIIDTSKEVLMIKQFHKEIQIPIKEIEIIETIRLFQAFSKWLKIGF